MQKENQPNLKLGKKFEHTSSITCLVEWLKPKNEGNKFWR